MNLNDCYNFNDFRRLAKKKLPAPIFHYIDGGSDDEVTLNRNTNAFNDCDLVPNILASVGEPIYPQLFLEEKLICHYFCLQQQCKAYIHLKEIGHQQGQQKNLIPCIVCQLWHHFQLKKLQIYQVDQSFFNYMFIKTSLLLTI